MPARVYVLLKIANGDGSKIARDIGRVKGVVSVDELEPPSPDLMVVIEAGSTRDAAGYLMKVLTPLDGVVDDLKVLPVKNFTLSDSPRRKTEKNAVR